MNGGSKWIRPWVRVVWWFVVLGWTPGLRAAVSVGQVDLGESAGLYASRVRGVNVPASGGAGLLNVSSNSLVLVTAGAVWKYDDRGESLPESWRWPDYDDAAWRSGCAPLGYGNQDECTVVLSNRTDGTRIITTYFRHRFAVESIGLFDELLFELVRDDGAIVYLNGEEALRSNMAAGPVDAQTRAASVVGGADESLFMPATLPITLLHSGANTLAVEIHQVSTTSSDISFDLRLTAVRRPPGVNLLWPGDGAGGVSIQPRLAASARSRGGSNVVSFFGRIPAQLAGPDFSVVALPDTQNYAARTSSIFAAQCEWIATNQQARNIRLVAHLGDVVEHGSNSQEWALAADAMYRLEDPLRTGLAEGVPYGIGVGNHDQAPKGDSTDGSTARYNAVFGIDHFAGRTYYGGHYGTNNDSHYVLFSAGGIEFIALFLEDEQNRYATNNPNLHLLAWADGVLQSHPQHRGIVVCHYVLEGGFNAGFSPQGLAIFRALRTNANFFLMLGAHTTGGGGEGQRVEVFNGRPIYTLMSDFQGWSNGGDGWLRLLTFSPRQNLIRVRTYSPTLDRYETRASSEFDLEYEMSDLTRGWMMLGMVTNRTAEATNEIVWPGLADVTDYEWVVEVADEVATTRSPVHRFRTGSNRPPTVSLSAQEDPLYHTVMLEANAGDDDGGVACVDFFWGERWLGSSDWPPYRYPWSDLPLGTQTFQFMAVARDRWGARATSAPVELTLEASPVWTPRIIRHPSSQTVLVGADVTLTVLAEGFSPLTYQWFFKGQPVFGCTNASWTLQGASTKDSGPYSVSVASGHGVVTSAAALLTVQQVPLRVTGLWRPPSGLVEIELSGEPGRCLVLSSSTNLESWGCLGGLLNSTGVAHFFHPTPTNETKRFYRALQLP